MNCACGHENPASAKFCLECGSSLAHRCAECATELPAGAKFCLECGHPVATVPGAAGDAEPRHEVRKVVTVVFVDLAGSTSLQEHMDPESVRRVMDRFYTQMRTEIEGAGGLVVKFTGDGVMAGFGIREAGEDDALRAVRAAARMQEAFAGFAEEIAVERGAEVALRVGVNTGEVVVSETDDDVVGDVVNVAARLEHAAGDGNVLVGDETRRLTRHAVTYEPIAPLELKGKAEPVPAYRLVSLEAPPEEEAAPFVGRTAELARLREVFEASVASAAPGIVTVVGSPGLGKTRLAEELAASVSGRARILEARCYAAATATYAPFAEALREAAAIPETATAEEVVSALEALLPADFPERSRIAKLTASVLGVGDAAAPQETFWATRRLLEGLTAVQPLVLIVDDVQWAEPMLLDLFDHIVEWAKGAAIVIVALARPEIREVRPSLIDAGAIVLEGLDPDDTAALAASLLGAHDLPETLVRRILEATEGNPLFVRELLRMLVDDGVLSRDGDRWTITVEASEIDVPPTIHALLAARIERLQDDERAVMERASVVGKEFYRGAVLELVPPRVGSGIDAHLETLRRKELVEPEGTYWIDERVFRFHHVLIRDAAYRRLLKEARAELHERFADWLERKVGDLVGEHEEVLGYHLEQAHTYRAELGSTDDRTAGLGRRAATHLASATRRALDRDDLTAAAQLSARALALTDDAEARADILLDRCEALLGMGQVGAATGAVTELRAQAADDRLMAWADCFDGQLAVLTDPSRLRDTATTVESAARRLADLGDTAGAAKAHAVHAQALAHLGQFGACEAALDRALAAAREAGDRRRANGVLASAPMAALWGPSPVPRASGRCLDVVRVLRITAGAPAVEATALRCQAVLEAMRGRTDAAHRMLASSRETLEELGLRHALVECDLFDGLIDLFAGDLPAAEASFRIAYEGLRALNIGTDTAQAAALLARTLVEQGQDEEALGLTEESERLGGDDLKTAIAWRCVRARVLARRGEAEAALDLARAAVALAEPTDALIDHADARLALAEVLRAAGRAEEAGAEERRAGELYSRKEAGGSTEEERSARSRPAPTPASDGPKVQARSGGVRAAAGVRADRAVADWRRFRDVMLQRDWDAMLEVLTPDHVLVDRRSGLRAELRGGQAWADAMRAMWQEVEADWDIEVLAVWSDEIFLTRIESFGEGWERAYLAVTLGRADAVCRSELFDEDDHLSALARLDELAYECSAAKPAVDAYVAAPNEHGWTEVDPIAGSGGAALVRVDGSFAVMSATDGRVTEVELFDDELGARRRLHQLTPSPSFVTWLVRHHFDRHAHQDWDALRTLNAPNVLVVDRRPVGWGTLSGIDRVLEHLQEGARTASMAPGQLRITEWLAIASDSALYRYRWAGRSPDGVDFAFDRLLLMRIRAGDGMVVRAYMYDPDQIDDARRLMAGTDVSHRAAPGVVADLAIYDRARAAMLERDRETMLALHTPDHVFVDHRAGLQSEVLGPTEFLEGSSETYQGLESGRTREILAGWAPDVVLSRSTSWGEGFEISSLVVRVTRGGAWCRTEQFDADDYVSVFARLDELSYEHSPVKPIIERHASTSEELDRNGLVGVAASGGAALVRSGESLAVVQTADGRVTEVELFDLDDELAARRRLHELAPSPSYVAWLARHHWDRHAHQDWDALRTLVTDDIVVVDHTPVGWGTVRGFDRLLDFVQEGARTASITPDGLWVSEWLAITPSATLTRVRWTGTTADGVDFAIDRLMVSRLRDGRTCHVEIFDPDRLDEARHRMERVSLALGPVTSGYQRILNAREWDRATEFFRPDYVVFDHRPAAFGGRSLGELIEGMKIFVDRAPNIRCDAEPLYTSPQAEVAILHMRGDTREGAAFELDIGAATRVVDGLGVSAITFEPDDVEAAIRWATDHSIGFEREDFEALRGGPARQLDERPGIPSVHTPRDGVFAEFGRRWEEAFEAGAGEEFAALYTPGFEVVEHTNHVTLDLEAHLDSMRQIAAQPSASARVENVVCLGARHGVNRTTFSWEQPEGQAGRSEVVGVSAVRLDDAGCCPRFEWFPADQLHRALARAEELYIEDEATGEALAGARRRLIQWRLIDAQNESDWEAVAEAFAPDVIFIDRRNLGWGAIEGRDTLIAAFRAIPARSLQHRWSLRDVHAIADDGYVVTVPISGTDQDGGRYEQGGVAVATMGDRGVTRLEFFEFDAVDDALSRFDELRAAASVTETAASTRHDVAHAFDRMALAYERADLDLIADIWASGVTYVDHVHGETFDHDAVVQMCHRIIRSTVGNRMTWEQIAWLGERHGVVRATWRWDTIEGSGEWSHLGAGENTWVFAVRVGDDGRILGCEQFVLELTHQALARAEELYIEEEATGDALAGARRRLVHWRMADAHNEGDWEALAAALAPDLESVDHRTLAWASVHGRDAFIEALRAVFARSQRHVWRISEVHAIADDGCVYTLPTEGIDADGGRYEQGGVVVVLLTDNGASRVEVFAFDATGEALERFEELRGEAASTDSSSNATLPAMGVRATTLERTLDRYYATLNGEVAVSEELFAREFRIRFHRWHLELDQARELEELERLAAGSATFRRGRTFLFGDRHGIVEHLISRAAGGGVGEVDSGQRMPWLGERASASWLDVGAVAARSWLSVRCGADGRLLIIEAFEEDELLETLARIEEMFLEDEASGEEAEASSHRLNLWRAFIADNEGDWETWRSLVEPDLVMVDRRAIGWGDLESEGIQQRQETMRELAGEHPIKVRSVAIDADAVLVDLAAEGTTEDGGRWELPVLVIQVGTKYQEHFDPEQREEAERRLHELASLARRGASIEELRGGNTSTQPESAVPDGGRPVIPRFDTSTPEGGADDSSPSNDFTRRYRAFHEALSRRDWRTAEAFQAPDIALEDRRAGLRDSLAGLEELLRNQRTAIELGYRIAAFDPIATRGDRMALVQWLWTVAGDSEIEMLVVGEMDDYDRISALVVFDPDDLIPALAELDERYDATLSTDLLEVRHVGYAVTEAYNDHDWDRLLLHYTPDVTVLDHRPAGWGTLRGSEAFGTLVRGLADLAPDISLLATSIDALTEEGTASTVSITGTDRNGASVELAYIIVWTLRDGRIDHYEVFPIEQRETAVARLHDLSRPMTTVGRTFERLLSALNGHDLEALPDLFASGYRGRDHRFHMEIDRDQALADLEVVMSGLNSVRPGRSVYLGDRHALGELIWSASVGAAGESEVSSWYVVRCDPDGRYLLTEVFPEDDLIEALGHAEELYLEDEADGAEAEASRHRLSTWRAFLAHNAGDWDAWSGFIDPDLVTISHHPLRSQEGVRTDKFLEGHKTLDGLVQEQRVRVDSVVIEGDVMMLGLAVEGTSKDGGRFEMPSWSVIAGTKHQELFPVEQRKEAERRFRELARAAHVQEAAGSTILSRAWGRLLSAWNARDIEAVGELVAPDYRAYEHPYHLEMDRDTVLADTERVLSRPGSVRSERAILLGDRHGLVDMIWTDGESEVTVWHARRCDVEGRFVDVEVFEAGDMLTAFARAEELYLEDEANGDEATWSRERLERLWRGMLAYNAGDLDGFAAQVPADFVTIDHRPGVVADFENREAWMAWLRTTRDVGRDWRFEVRSVRVDRNVVLLDMASIGTDDEGGSVETPLLDVVVPGVRQEMYLPEQREEAEARFQELVGGH